MKSLLHAGLVLAALAAALGAASVAHATGTGLSGETFLLPDFFSFSNPHCDAAGMSSFSFSAGGPAFGPYPGTYRESGTVVIGLPIAGPSPNLGVLFPAGFIVDLDASFSIDSPAGQVSGTKRQVVPVPGNVGSCELLPTLPPEILPLHCSDIQTESVWAPELGYQATIRSPLGTFDDAGGTALHASNILAVGGCAEFPGAPCCGGSFYEEFFTESPVDTPGSATGGGEVAGTGSSISFGFNAASDGATFKGECSVLDHTLGTLVKCLDVESFVEVVNRATITGVADVDGTATRYRIDVTDGGEPSGVSGTKDTFLIQTDSGYFGGGVLTEGNVQVSSG